MIAGMICAVGVGAMVGPRMPNYVLTEQELQSENFAAEPSSGQETTTAMAAMLNAGQYYQVSAPVTLFQDTLDKPDAGHAADLLSGGVVFLVAPTYDRGRVWYQARIWDAHGAVHNGYIDSNALTTVQVSVYVPPAAAAPQNTFRATSRVNVYASGSDRDFYHTVTCRSISANATAIPLSVAVERGLSPCPRCRPRRSSRQPPSNASPVSNDQPSQAPPLGNPHPPKATHTTAKIAFAIEHNILYDAVVRIGYIGVGLLRNTPNLLVVTA